MDAQTVTAIAGIVGTLAAGLGGTYLGSRLERKAELQREEADVRRAARLIDADLMFAETAARTSVDQRHWWVSDRRLTTEGWQQYREVIASKMPWADWLAVIVAVEAVGHLQGSRDHDRKLQRAKMATDPETSGTLKAADALGLDVLDPAPDIPEATATQIEPMLSDLEAGRAALSPLIERTRRHE